MSEEKTYLEYSEEDGVSHKFYEVTVRGNEVATRYGRIGTDGRTITKEYDSAQKARSEADKKISKKISKGYERAVMGVRQRRPITRRTIESRESSADRAPVIWKFDTGRSAFGICIDHDSAWVGNQDGHIYECSHDGDVVRRFNLPDGVKCIIEDEEWLYAGCDDGKVYDLTGKVPHVAYEIAEDVDIYWLDVADAVLGVSDKNGNIAIFNHEDESQWRAQSSGSSGWMVRCDEIGVYHGHSNGVTMYDWFDGSVIWDQSAQGAVLFGWQEESALYVGTTRNKVHQFKKTGELVATYDCDASVFSCATSEDGEFVFAGDNHSSIYCFDAAGERLWKLDTGGNGSAFSMQYYEGKLFVVTTTGALFCMDATPEAIENARRGEVPDVRDIEVDTDSIEQASVGDAIETTEEVGDGVLVHCVEEGSKIRVRVLSEGYHSDWNVQFPRDLREEGARFVVEDVRESTRGGFYRTYGEIRRLD